MIVVAYALGAVVAVAAVIAEPGTIGTVFPIVVTAASLAIAYTLVLIWRRASLRRSIAEMRSDGSFMPAGPAPCGPGERPRGRPREARWRRW